MSEFLQNAPYTVISGVVNPSLDYKVSKAENVPGGKVLIEDVVFQVTEDSNQNGMRFLDEDFRAAISSLQPEVDSRHFVGELDHPDDLENISRMQGVNLKEISHVIPKIRVENKKVIGSLETLGTPNGVILSTLLKENIKIGVSIRAITNQDISYSMENIDTIRNFKLVCYDVVHRPAYKDAYITSILSSVKHIPQISREEHFTEDDVILLATNMATEIIKRLHEKKVF